MAEIPMVHIKVDTSELEALTARITEGELHVASSLARQLVSDVWQVADDSGWAVMAVDTDWDDGSISMRFKALPVQDVKDVL